MADLLQVSGVLSLPGTELPEELYIAQLAQEEEERSGIYVFEFACPVYYRYEEQLLGVFAA